MRKYTEPVQRLLFPKFVIMIFKKFEVPSNNDQVPLSIIAWEHSQSDALSPLLDLTNFPAFQLSNLINSV